MIALKINWNSLRWVGLAAFAIVCVALLGKPVGLVAAQPIHMPTFQLPVAEIGFSSGTLNIPINGTGTTDVQVSDVVNLAGVEFHITFDPAQLQVMSTAAGAFFNQNGVPMPVIPTHNNTTGKVDFVGSVVPPATPYSGTAPVGVGSITWKVVSCPASGQIPLTLVNTKLSDPNGAAITYTRSDSSIVCPQVTLPAAPSNLTATAMSSSQIDLAWADNANDEDGFKIERCAGTGCTNFAQITTVISNVVSHSDTGLTAETTYCYRVRAFNSGGDSDYSNTACATTPQALPAAPSNLTASAVSVSRIDLAWTDNANNEDGLKIERCTGTGCTSFAQITTVASNVTSHSDTGLAAETTYCYRVRAYNLVGDSNYSNVACATTQPTSITVPVTGTVLLQGRTDHSVTTVYLTEDACPAVQAVSIKGLPNVVTAVTDAAGKFTLEPLPGRTYQCVLATHDMYLTARRSITTGTLLLPTLPAVTLPGGNVVADKTINIFDLARIANSIGTSDSTVDINGDGKVDVYDLTIAAGNFGKEGPLPW